MRSFRFSQAAGALVLLAAVTAVAACEGPSRGYVPTSTGSSGTTTAASPSPSPSSGTVTTSTTASVTLPTLSDGGFQVGGSLPEANVVAAVTEALSITAPSGVTAFKKHREDTSTPGALIYLSFSSTSSVTLSGTPALTFTSSEISSGSTYYLVLNTSSGWENPVSGPGTVSGDTVSFTSVSGSIAMTPTQPAVFALVAESVPAASPNQLVFDESSPAPQTFTVSESGYSGTFSEQTDCTENPIPSPPPTTDPYVVQVTPSSATPSSAGAAVTFTVTPGEETGSCTITVSDGNSATTTVSAIVAQDQVIIYDRKRH